MREECRRADRPSCDERERPGLDLRARSHPRIDAGLEARTTDHVRNVAPDWLIEMRLRLEAEYDESLDPSA
jgi:hypothetical protein